MTVNQYIRIFAGAFILASLGLAHANGQADLSQYRAVVLTSHPEYWTNEMRLALEAYLKRGGSVVYLGGNGIYERVSLRDGRMEGYNHRQVHEQDGLLGGFFYLNEWPQSQILGVQYDSRGFGESEPYVVEDARSWVFAGTGVRPGDRFGRGTMGIEQIGAAGHETDKMNAASPPGTMLLARGDGRSGAHMTLYEHPAGGFVFAAGSIAFGLTLGQDDVQGRVVRNVLDAALKR